MTHRHVEGTGTQASAGSEVPARTRIVVADNDRTVDVPQIPEGIGKACCEHRQCPGGGKLDLEVVRISSTLDIAAEGAVQTHSGGTVAAVPVIIS